MEEDVVQVSESGLMLRDFCSVFEKDRGREAVSEVCEDKEGKPGSRTRWLQLDARRSRYYFVEEMAVCNEDLENAGWVEGKISLSALR